MAIARIIRKEGSMVPNDATTLPLVPRSFVADGRRYVHGQDAGQRLRYGRKDRESHLSRSSDTGPQSQCSIMEIMAQPSGM